MRLHENDIFILEDLFRQGQPATQVEVAALFDYIARLEQRPVPFDWLDSMASADDRAEWREKKPRGHGMSIGRGGALPDGNSNACPSPRAPRVRPQHLDSKKYRMRFGSRAASALLVLELAAGDRIESGFDTEWFEGEFLYRLRAALIATWPEDDAFRRQYDWHATHYQYESIDLEVLLSTGKRAYRRMLLDVLRSIYDEEGIGGGITDAVRRRFRLPLF